MTQDSSWKRFEKVVTHIERALASKGAIVTFDDKVEDKNGHLRQVDATVRIPYGKGNLLVLLECRKRSKVSDQSWIEQLVQKKINLRAARIIAVSDKPLSRPAQLLAKQDGMEVRTLHQLEQNVEIPLDLEGFRINEIMFEVTRFTVIADIPPASMPLLSRQVSHAFGDRSGLHFRTEQGDPISAGKIILDTLNLLLPTGSHDARGTFTLGLVGPVYATLSIQVAGHLAKLRKLDVEVTCLSLRAHLASVETLKYEFEDQAESVFVKTLLFKEEGLEVSVPVILDPNDSNVVIRTGDSLMNDLHDIEDLLKLNLPKFEWAGLSFVGVSDFSKNLADLHLRQRDVRPLPK